MDLTDDKLMLVQEMVAAIRQQAPVSQLILTQVIVPRWRLYGHNELKRKFFCKICLQNLHNFFNVLLKDLHCLILNVPSVDINNISV